MDGPRLCQFVRCTCSGKRLRGRVHHEFGPKAKDCRDCRDNDEPCAVGGFILGSLVRCPVTAFKPQSRLEHAVWQVVQRLHVWTPAPAGPPRLDAAHAARDIQSLHPIRRDLLGVVLDAVQQGRLLAHADLQDLTPDG